MNEIYSTLDSMIKSNERGVVGTVVAGHPLSCPIGLRFLVDHQGKLRTGEIDSGILDYCQEALKEVISTKKPKVVNFSWQDQTLRIFLDPIYPKSHLVILGGGHIALPLVSLGKMLDYEVSVVDDRLSFANFGRFPQANQVICDDFRKAFQKLEFDSNTYVVIVTRGHRHDRTCLEEVLVQPKVGYVGMIGSRHKIAALFQELRDKDFTEEQIQSIYTPIGLDIGAQTPEEIAVSIMAEIIMISRQGYSEGLKTRNGGSSNGR